MCTMLRQNSKTGRTRAKRSRSQKQRLKKDAAVTAVPPIKKMDPDKMHQCSGHRLKK